MLSDLLSGQFDQTTIIELIAHVAVILLILPLHEMAHAWAAYKLGDDTASIQGRMTLNPIAHIDPIGALLLLFTGYGWAKPVPVNPLRFNRKHSMRFGMAVTAIAGPLSNLIAAFIGMVIFRFFLCSGTFLSGWVAYFENEESSLNVAVIIFYFLRFFISVNIGLALFNLIPVPPLDGSKVIGYFTSAKVDRWFRENQQIVSIIFLVILFSGLLMKPLGFLNGKIWDFMFWSTNWIPKVMG